MSAPLICFTGVDGCGKSTQARRLAQHLRSAGWTTVTVWTGGQKTLSHPLVLLGQRHLRAPRRDADRRYRQHGASVPVSEQFGSYMASSHSLFRKHRLLGRVWTDISLFEHALEIDYSVLPHLIQNRAVVCDRYIYKSVVNLAVLLDLTPSEIEALLRHPAVRGVPQPTLYFLLDLPAAVAYNRKHDIPSVEYVERRVPVYRHVAENSGMTVIDATQSPDVVESQVRATVERVLTARGMRPPRRG